MNLIAWNEKTDTAITPERLPVDLEWARFPSGVKKQYHEPVEPEQEKPVIEIANIQMPAAELNGSIYWIAKDAPVVITADCQLPDGELMVMVERVIDASNTVDAIRTKAVIAGGVMTMSFVFEASGNYIFRKSRLNEGLNRIGAEFNLNFDNVEFDVFI